VRLPRPNSAYSSAEIIEDDLRSAGFASRDKGYLVYYDGNPHVGEEFGLCGHGMAATRPLASTIVYLQTCAMSFNDEERQVTVAHEMVHGLGAVVSSAPHACSGHTCDNPNDLMKATGVEGETLSQLLLDPGRDDYYGHSGSWWAPRTPRSCTGSTRASIRRRRSST
jgi:hypothetical protein